MSKMKNIFNLNDTTELINRINKLNPTVSPKWGKMNVSQMLAHCNVTYEMIFESIHPKPNAFLKFILKRLVKNKVVNETAYKRNGNTAPQFIIKESKDFIIEQKRLVDYISNTQKLGEAHFDGKESHSFGPLTKTEWNNMLYKHLDHHLSQFGV
jgi:hypothetical protein